MFMYPVTLTPDPLVAELRCQAIELQTRLAVAQDGLVAMAGKLGAAQAEVAGLQHERDRAEKLTGEVADLAKQLARVVEEAGAREREMQGQLTEIRTRSWWRRLVG